MSTIIFDFRRNLTKANSIVFWLVVSSVFSIFSILMTGFRVSDNNYFHSIILLKLWREPQFSSDAFVQSLRYFSSGFWQIQAGLVSPNLLEHMLFIWFFASRMLLIFGIYSWCAVFEIRQRVSKIMFLGISMSLAIMRDYSYMGNGGLMIDSFTHSELANGFALLALSMTVRKRYSIALTTVGLVGFLNLFMGVWLAPLIMALLVAQIATGTVQGPTLVRRAWPGALLGLALLAPVMMNLANNPDLGRPQPFDYRDYLAEFWPLHFFVQNQPHRDMYGIVIVFSSWVGFTSLLPDRPRKAMLLLGTGVIALWILGAILPLATSSSLLLNLHILRVSTYFHLLTGLSAAAVLVRWFTGTEPADRLFWAPALFAASAISIATSALVAPLLIVRLVWRAPKFLVHTWVRSGFLILIATSLALVSVKHIRYDIDFNNKKTEWTNVSAWAAKKNRAGFALPFTC